MASRVGVEFAAAAKHNNYKFLRKILKKANEREFNFWSQLCMIEKRLAVVVVAVVVVAASTTRVK